ncbi:non-ribosomal peptide synthetase [Nodularia spumigena]|uniref:non-ribosomal peptide synthetase n=1 Tax=Nodularia spumigena TaxID=70799 RepID=UPI00232D63CF|nr:amino acid adenylation domain-containing protein [Nodularia spumigena]MDB9319491.1 amino acid adenylation domain-containing protein [Nodularia spumigena CS-590/01A]MDB9323096.1 amino acid adenylation domain-containing protein [Nodularia spumigena CS-591/07A]MDB9325680.1 amino acid adenylation domain-containing protein [Nodularia spumigena CS-590/02]MDB9332793.1 amino acid adenylation domain-containing protein [Nodularia spumigena CS-591/04]MDB9336642.1 amino acid adenylation domain-containi
MQSIEDLYELSPMQQGMLFHTLYAPKSEVYFEQLLCILSGELNFAAFQKAWEQVVARHSILRSSFFWEEIEKPLQMVSKQVDLPWEKLDWRHLTTDEQKKQLEELLKSDRQKGFDLNQVPLMRFTIIQLTDHTYQFIWSHHHILFDGWSMQIVLKEVFTLYEANQRGEYLRLSPVRPYKEYIEWLQQQDIEKAKQFWQQTLKGFETPTLIGNREQGTGNRSKGIYNEQRFQLSETVTEKLQNAARQHHLTLNNLVQGAWSLLISRYSSTSLTINSGEKDVVFGGTVSGRQPVIENIESMVGLLINTIPTRVKIDNQKQILSWLQELQNQAVEQEQYSYFPMAEIQQVSDIFPGMPLFESLLVFENYPVDSRKQDTQKTLEISHLSCFERTNYPLTIVINPGSQLGGRFVYDTSCFDEPTIDRIIASFQTLLTRFVDNLQQKISQISLLSGEEEQELILLENHQNPENINYQCLHVLFEEQVQKTPDKIAVVYKQENLTYRELNNRANQLANYLKSLGVKAETRVGICVERSLEMVIGILAILKAGGTYVPLDPAYPSERLALMLEDVQTPILLTQTHLQNKLPLNNQIVVNLDTDEEKIAQYPADNLPCEVTPENLAYIIYTSGSTGTPKGTEVPHRSFMGFMFGVDYIHFDENQIWLQHSSISWDGLTLEMWTPLLYGGRCVLYPEKIPTAEKLTQIIQEQKVNTLFLTTALFNFMIDTMPEGLSEIKQLLTGGEAVSVSHVRRALELLPETQIIHGYGPSECTVFTCCYPIPEKLAENFKSIPIGKPIGDRTVYILDTHLNRVPIGVPGELYIGGASVARGYLNQPKLTRERFISNPFIEGDTLYKTGDLVRRLPDGNIEFIGRIDNQVKLRGFRIELAEIEAVLNQHPDIQQVVVIAREDEPGKKLLVAYLVAQDNVPTPSSLRNFLKSKLPDYMIPAAFVFLENLPLTPNGKINRRALPIPDHTQRILEVDFVPPSTDTEKELADIWQEVLKLKQVGINDNFFELGGHSLLATQAISRLREVFALDFPLRYLFENPTIAELAQKVIEQQIEQAENDELARILAEVDQLSEEEVTQQLMF